MTTIGLINNRVDRRDFLPSTAVIGQAGEVANKLPRVSKELPRGDGIGEILSTTG